MLGEEGLEVVGEGSRKVGVAVRNMGDQVNQVVELADIVNGGGRGGGEEDLLLGIVGEPLVVKLLRVGPGRGMRLGTCL